MVAGVMGLMFMLAVVTIWRTTPEDCHHGIGFQEKNNKIHASRGMEIVESRLKLTQKNFNNKIKIQSNSFGTQVILVLDNY